MTRNVNGDGKEKLSDKKIFKPTPNDNNGNIIYGFFYVAF